MLKLIGRRKWKYISQFYSSQPPKTGLLHIVKKIIIIIIIFLTTAGWPQSKICCLILLSETYLFPRVLDACGYAACRAFNALVSRPFYVDIVLVTHVWKTLETECKFWIQVSISFIDPVPLPWKEPKILTLFILIFYWSSVTMEGSPKF